ncbi:melatonin receptor type 1B-B-like [Diadema antillarum]|uniref:melatonin receptor type 1B-B-like n=1 Tax=Diadema antillarum TaxID=105358 RepID=UPI003A859FA8
MAEITVNSTFIGSIYDPYDDLELVISNSVLACVVALITITGVLGNSFVILLVSLSRQLQTVTNVFVVSLTLSDLIGCSMLSLEIVALLNLDGWPLPEWVCQMTGGVCVIAFVASVAHLALISVDRFVLITRPKTRYMRLYKGRNIIMMVAFAWLAPLLSIVLPTSLGFGRLGYNAANYFCVFDGTKLQLRMVHIFEEVLFATTFSIIISCYVRIYLYVRRQHRNLLQFYDDKPESSQEPQSSSMRMTIDKREIEITKNLFMVVCGYFICVLPNSFCVLFESCYVKYFKFTAVVYSINSCINPFIYCFKQPLFRQISLCVFRRRWADIPKPSPWLQGLVDVKVKKGTTGRTEIPNTVSISASLQDV